MRGKKSLKIAKLMSNVAGIDFSKEMK